jgi:hypothetical protein
MAFIVKHLLVPFLFHFTPRLVIPILNVTAELTSTLTVLSKFCVLRNVCSRLLLITNIDVITFPACVFGHGILYLLL